LPGHEVPFQEEYYYRMQREGEEGTRVRWVVGDGKAGVMVLLVTITSKWIDQADPLNSSEFRSCAMGCRVEEGETVDEVISFGMGGWLDYLFPMKIVHVTHARFFVGARESLLGYLGMKRSGVEGSVEGVGGNFSSAWLYEPYVDSWDQSIPTGPMRELRRTLFTDFDVRRGLVFWTTPGQNTLTEHGDLTVNMIGEFPAEGSSGKLHLTPY
jgi:hypothetical protein